MADLTGYYITEIDLSPYISFKELKQLTHEINEETKETNVQQLMKNVCALADSKLQNKYDIPLAGAYITDSFKSALAKIVVWDLSSSYESLSDNVFKIREKHNDDAVKYLDSLGEGKSKLINPLTDTKEADKYYFDSDQRITRDFR